MPATRRVGLLGALVGVIAGCSLGLLNLLIVDTRQSSDLKARQYAEAGTEAGTFQIEADNAALPDATTLVVEGPDLPGLLASLSAALSASGVHLVEASVRAGTVQGSVRDVFIVRGRDGGQVDDDALDDLARALLLAARDPAAYTPPPQTDAAAIFQRVLEQRQARQQASPARSASRSDSRSDTRSDSQSVSDVALDAADSPRPSQASPRASDAGSDFWG